jgi:GcvH upstream region-like protein
MLNFLRKYQKVVFGMVTAALILSISFFGSYGAVSGAPAKEKDHVIGTAIDGSTMSRLEIDKMIRFISTDKMDTEVMYKNKMPNVFNDGVIRKDFIQTGLAQMVVESYFEDIKEDLALRLEKQKRFAPYAHPGAPFLSAEAIWSQFLPSLHQNLMKIKAKGFEVNPENFKVLSDVYLESSRFPSSLLRRFLSYQESQYQWIAKDPYLSQGDLSLFHFHDVQDWFGPSFVEVISQFVHNASLYAKQKGYKVSYEEAKAELLKQGYDALVEQTQESVTAEVLDKYWKENLYTMRIDEIQAVSIWQKVMLFRKLFEDYGQSVFVDKLAYNEYHGYTSEAVEVQRYKLPKDLQLGDFGAFLKFQTYLEAIAQEKKLALQLDPPQSVKTLDEIQKETPSLLERSYEIELAHLKREEALLEIPLKETWEWQSKEENFGKLKAEFKELASAKSTEDPLEVLDRLHEDTRLAIDKFSRNEMLKERPELITKALQSKPLEKKTLHLSLGDGATPLAGIEYNELLDALLEKAATEPEKVMETLERYTQDEKHYYRISVLSKPSEIQLLSFKQASDKGILDKILVEKLKKYHLQAQSMNPALFQNEDGSFKDFASVKNHIGAFIYRDLLESIEKDFVKSGGELKAGSRKEPLEFYATHRLYHFVRESKADIENKGLASSYLQKEHLYHLESDKEVVKRKEKITWATEDLFSMDEKTFSPIHVAANGDISFFQVLKKSQEEDKELIEELKEGQRLMAEDAKRHLMQEILTLLESTDSIHLEKVKEGEEGTNE